MRNREHLFLRTDTPVQEVAGFLRALLGLEPIPIGAHDPEVIGLRGPDRYRVRKASCAVFSMPLCWVKVASGPKVKPASAEAFDRLGVPDVGVGDDARVSQVDERELAECLEQVPGEAW